MPNNPISIEKLREVYDCHTRRYKKLTYTFDEFVDFCKTFHIRNDDFIDIGASFTAPEIRISDLRVRRKDNGSEYTLNFEELREELRYEIMGERNEE